MKKSLTLYLRRYGDAARFLSGRRRLPWVQALTNIRQRCDNPNDPKFKYYGGRGVRCRITSAQLKAAFFRDKAWLLQKPSVDRIRTRGNYHHKNVRWIELGDNIMRRYRGGLIERKMKNKS